MGLVDNTDTTSESDLIVHGGSGGMATPSLKTPKEFPFQNPEERGKWKGRF